MYDAFSRLERQIMQAIYRRGQASVAEVVAELQAEESHESIRVTIHRLERKGHLRHVLRKGRNVYSPTVREERARKSAMDNLLRTFFRGSTAAAVLGFLDRADAGLSPKEAAEIRARIKAAEEGGPGRGTKR